VAGGVSVAEETVRMARYRFFDLQTATHLLRKLEHDYAQLRQDPANVYVAYNFFVTAENMPEWVEGKAFKLRIQQQKTILKLCNELATGAKHMIGKKHPAITEMRREGLGASRLGLAKAGEGPSLMIDLAQQERETLHRPSIDALTLAAKVLAYWQRYLQAHSTP
jgi:hypothetical protein